MLHKLNYGLKNLNRWGRWIKDLRLDLKYGLKFLGGNISNDNPTMGWTASTSSDYEAISVVFKQIDFRANDILVDIGCGKGRVFNWALNNGIKNEMIGIEVHSSIAQFARFRLRKYPQIKIITGNICDPTIIPKNGTIFYLFNPFSEEIVKNFAEQIINLNHKSKFDTNRPLIIYYYCCHLHIFENNPLWQIQKLGIVSRMGLEAAIISLNKV